MFLNVPDPVLDVVKALLVGDVVDEHDAHGPSVVGRRDRSEALLARRVPDLELDLFAIQLYCADFEVDTYPTQKRSLIKAKKNNQSYRSVTIEKNLFWLTTTIVVGCL